MVNSAESAAAPGALPRATPFPLNDVVIRQVISTPPHATLGEVLHLMEDRRISCVVVVEGPTPVGIFTERDAVRLMAASAPDRAQPIREFMSKPVVTVGTQIDLQQSYQMLSGGHFRHLVVVNEHHELVGIVTESDFVEHVGASLLAEDKTVAEVMNRQVVTLAPDACLADAVATMARLNLSCLVAIEGDQPVGIVSERDVVSFCNAAMQLEPLTIRDVMSWPLHTVGRDMRLQDAARLMQELGVRRLVVIDDAGALAGLLTRHDIVRALEGRYTAFLRETIERQQEALDRARGLLESAERQLLYRSVIDQMDDSLLVVESASGQIVEVNDHACRGLGYTRDELLRMAVVQISAVARSAEEWQALAEAFTRTGSTVLETEHRRKDGSRFPVEVSVRHVAGGERSLLVAVARDISERKRGQQALVERELQLRTLIEALPDAVFFKDARGAWQVVNSQGLALFGLTGSTQWRGRTEQELAELNPAMAQAHVACFESDERAWTAAAPLLCDEWFPDAAGKVRHLEVIKVPIHHPDGSRNGLVIVGRDVTEQRLAAERIRASEASYRGLFNSVTEAIYIQDEEGHFLDVNRAAEQMYGHPREAFIGKTPEFLAAPGMNDLAATAERLRRSFDGEPQQFEFWGLRSNGEAFPKEVSVSAGSYFGRPAAIVVARDVSERRLTEERLRQAAAVYESTAEGVMITDVQGSIVAVNRAFADITGYRAEEVVGRPASLLRSGRHERAFFSHLWRSLLETGAWQGELWNRRKNGEVYPEWLTISSVRDPGGRVMNYVGVFSDISLVKHSEAKLDRLAHYDPLTDLPNRLLFHSRLDHALERAHRVSRHLALLFLDVDRFKTVNDSLGHPSGDELLVAIASRVQTKVRAEDTLARHSGDEFVLLLETLERPEDAAALAQEILSLLAEPFRLSSGHEVYASASIGISLYPNDGLDATQLVRNADAAMYQAKEAGGNAYRFYTGALTRAARERLSLETRLRRALEREEFTLHFQPQVDLATGRIVGTEALIRWISPDEGMVHPIRFIPISEETGLIVPVGEWVLRRACATAREWLDAGLSPITLAVNLSSRQFREPQLVQKIRSILEETALPPSLLEVEITESMIMERGPQAVAIMNELKDLGLTLAIDDFGTGYSSLASLKRFAVDKLKIDRSFVRDIPDDLSDMEIAATIIAMGRNLGLRVLAEGVETEAQLNFLRVQGCHEAQGFLWSQPVSGEIFAKLLADGPQAP